MQIIDAITQKYMDEYGGGTRYPDYTGVTSFDWIERGSRLVLFLDCDEVVAQSIVDANPQFSARIVTAEEVSAFVWQDTRNTRNSLLAESVTLRDRHRDERELVTASIRPETTLTEPQYIELLTYIDALRQIPQGFPYPAAVVWPEKPAFINQ